MVGLPSADNREKILRTLLSKESVEKGLDFLELGRTTEGYSGSDLKVSLFTAFVFSYKIYYMLMASKYISTELVHYRCLPACSRVDTA